MSDTIPEDAVQIVADAIYHYHDTTNADEWSSDEAASAAITAYLSWQKEQGRTYADGWRDARGAAANKMDAEAERNHEMSLRAYKVGDFLDENRFRRKWRDLKDWAQIIHALKPNE